MNQKQKWNKPNNSAWQRENQVHIWLINFEKAEKNRADFKKLLSQEERERAARFYFDKDTLRYSVTRALLRSVLAKMLHVTPQEIEFIHNQYGKPALNQKTNLYFNISHSGNYGLMAITDRTEIGVDVEHFRKEMTAENIAQRFFSPKEVADFNALPKEQKLEGFFNCWTRKEAFIKAVGMGLSLPLNSFDVTLTPGVEPHVLDVRYNNIPKTQWHLQNIVMEEKYAAAFILRAQNFNINFWHTERPFH